jgi:hypothetical protein
MFKAGNNGKKATKKAGANELPKAKPPAAAAKSRPKRGH